MPKTFLTQSEIKSIIRLYKAGKSSREIAQKFRRNVNTISKVLRRNNIPVRSACDVSESLKKKMIDLYQNGESFKAIGKKYKKSGKTVAQILRQNNVNTRTRKQRNFSQDDITQIIYLYQCGESCQPIGARFGVSDSVIASLLRKHNIQIRSHGGWGKEDSQKYLIVDPHGEIYSTDNLRDFCIKHQLSKDCMRKIAQGKMNFHKGWTCFYDDGQPQLAIKTTLNDSNKSDSNKAKEHPSKPRVTLRELLGLAKS